MSRIEDLSGIQGDFEGQVRAHPSKKLRMRALADGTLTYTRKVNGECLEVTIPIKGVSVKTIYGDFRRFIRVKRGPKGNRDKILGIVDKD